MLIKRENKTEKIKLCWEAKPALHVTELRTHPHTASGNKLKMA